MNLDGIGSVAICLLITAVLGFGLVLLLLGGQVRQFVEWLLKKPERPSAPVPKGYPTMTSAQRRAIDGFGEPDLGHDPGDIQNMKGL